MGNRLSKIYTRTGDKGETGLGDGSRVAKDSLRVEAYGTTDELNSTIGLMITEVSDGPIREALLTIQHDLFDLGGELCIPGRESIQQSQIDALEGLLDQLNEGLEPLKEFILPGGSRAAAYAHLARTICRRSERRVISLAREEAVSSAAIKYLNRLSDLLFVLARVVNRGEGVADVLWQPDRAR